MSIFIDKFTRRTILAATDTLVSRGRADITRFLLEFSLEDFAPEEDDRGYSLVARDRVNLVARHLISSLEERAPGIEDRIDEVVTRLVNDAIHEVGKHFDTASPYERFKSSYPALDRALQRDGFTVEKGSLLKAMPSDIAMPQQDDEVHELLKKFGFSVALGHLNQGIEAHSDGNWAAANAQFRTFMESLLTSIAEQLAQQQGVSLSGKTDHEQRTWLRFGSAPPFFDATLNEWDGQGKGFFEGFFKRLHPQGSHPGLSDEDDSTFRLHLVLITSRLALRRLHTISPPKEPAFRIRPAKPPRKFLR